MEIDSQVLLVLLAVRSRGGQGAPAASDEFKALKKGVAQAKDKGWVAEEQAEISVTGKTGKTTRKKAPVLSLTAAGGQVLQQAASTEALAATGALHAQSLQKALETDRQALRQEVLAALAGKAKGKGPGDPTAELKKISATLEKLAGQVTKLETALAGSADAAVLDKIDQAFAKLQSKLSSAGPAAATQTKPTDGSASAAPASLRSALQQAYRTLCQFFEFEDGVVKLPNLYHETRKHVPSLTVEAFHRELESLWSQRVLELKVLNEVRSASEPDKGLRRDDALYYFVYWPKP